MKLAVEYLTVPREGETLSGDVAVVRHEAAQSLLAVVDALGHGVRAAAVADVATQYLGAATLAQGLRRLVEGLHEALRGTRGAAAMILLVGAGRVEGCGVGNVEVRGGRDLRLPAVLTPGVLGAQNPRFRLFDAPLAPRGRIVIFSDGVSARMSLEDVAGLAPREACRMLMDRHRRPGDDATVLVTDIEA